MGASESAPAAAAVVPVIAPMSASATKALLTFEMLDEHRDEKTPIETDQLAHDYGALFLSKKFSDVTFVVGPKEEKFPAHRMLLAARSKVFEAMFYSHFEESQGGDIVIEEVSAPAFRTLLQTIYTDQAQLQVDTIMDVLYAAKKYQVHSLTAMCLRFMQKGLTPENACALLEMAPHLLEDEKFAIDFIERNAGEVIESAGFLNLSPAALSRVIRSDHLTIPEVELFEEVLKWARRECGRKHMEPTKPNIKRVLAPIIPYIRFPTMSHEDLTGKVSPSEILTQEQLVSLYVYLASKADVKPPVAWPTAQRAPTRGLWRFDASHKSTSITLSQGNMHAKLLAPGHSWVLGSKELSHGKHCWRVHLERLYGSQWVFIGIVAANRKNSLKSLSFADTTCYGFSTRDQIYHGGPTRRGRYWQNKFSKVDWQRQGDTIDVMLDCEASTLRLLNVKTRREWTLVNLPRKPYVPHFNLYDLNNEIRVETLKVEEMGVLNRTAR